ncbi:hypothetical protein BH10PLA2_BH10PLA2_14820 [soil metagenome]
MTPVNRFRKQHTPGHVRNDFACEPVQAYVFYRQRSEDNLFGFLERDCNNIIAWIV